MLRRGAPKRTFAKCAKRSLGKRPPSGQTCRSNEGRKLLLRPRAAVFSSNPRLGYIVDLDAVDHVEADLEKRLMLIADLISAVGVQVVEAANNSE